MTTILPQVEEQLRAAAERRARRRWPRRVRGGGPRRALAASALAAAVVAAVLAFALAGGDGRRQFDVAAAVYHALPDGPGVLYTVTEQVTGLNGLHARSVTERWRTASPPRERTVGWEWRNYGREHFWRGEGVIPVGGTWSSWSTFRPGVIEHTKGKGILSAEAAGLNPSAIRAAYQSGRLRLLGTGNFEGKAEYRLRMPCSTCRDGRRWIPLMVDARTFLPIFVEYARDRQGHKVPRFVMRYLVYKELPLTRASLALLKMRPHPGARVVER